MNIQIRLRDFLHDPSDLTVMPSMAELKFKVFSSYVVLNFNDNDYDLDSDIGLIEFDIDEPTKATAILRAVNSIKDYTDTECNKFINSFNMYLFNEVFSDCRG